MTRTSAPCPSPAVASFPPQVVKRFQKQVQFGDSLVLAEVLGPGVDFPLFGELIGVGWVVPQDPQGGSGSAPGVL